MHILDLRHAKRVVQASRERSFTVRIKILWRVTFVVDEIFSYINENITVVEENIDNKSITEEVESKDAENITKV